MRDFLPWRGSMKFYWFQFWKWKLWHLINSPLSWLELWCWDWTPQHDICLLVMYSSQRWEVREVLVVAVSLTRERGEMWIFHKINVGCIDTCRPLGNCKIVVNVFVTIHTFIPSCLHNWSSTKTQTDSWGYEGKREFLLPKFFAMPICMMHAYITLIVWVKDLIVSITPCLAELALL